MLGCTNPKNSKNPVYPYTSPINEQKYDALKNNGGSSIDASVIPSKNNLGSLIFALEHESLFTKYKY